MSVTTRPTKTDVQAVLSELKRLGTVRTRDGFKRYGIEVEKAFGVAMNDIQKLARTLGSSHDLAIALWKAEWYEARLLAAFVDEADHVTPAQMDRWCRDFDNWGICDTVCFKLFDRTPHAFDKIKEWAGRPGEFAQRASFALLASVALHDKRVGDQRFIESLALIERAAVDERNFVKKGVSWALRAIGGRNAQLHEAAVALARRLAASPQPAARWIGKDALRDLTRPLIVRRVAAAERPSSK
jgi:3-methyladenine DNA glycosylase AlkD